MPEDNVRQERQPTREEELLNSLKEYDRQEAALHDAEDPVVVRIAEM